MPEQTSFLGGEIETKDAIFHVIRIPFRQLSTVPGQPAKPYLSVVEFQFIGPQGSVPTAVTNAALSDGTPSQESSSPEFWRAVKQLLIELYP